MARSYTSQTLGECRREVIRLVCARCGRKGQYRRETLLAKYGPDVTMPDLRHKIANCPKNGALGTTCGVRYADLIPRDG